MVFAQPFPILALPDADASANGKALEHACLAALAKHLTNRGAHVQTLNTPATRTALNRFAQLNPNANRAYLAAAEAGIELLTRVEPVLRTPPAGSFTLKLQQDAQGETGDVRDLLIHHTSGWELGISIKHNNTAAKHSRLSHDLDFAARWFGAQASRDYFLATKPVFDQLEEHARIGAHWSALGLREVEKAVRFYRPVLAALAAELSRQAAHSQTVAPALLRYMTGRRDFYKLIATIKADRTEIQAFCFDGELGRSTPAMGRADVLVPRLHVPTKLLAVDFKPNSHNTLLVRFDHSWALSLRIHSASSRVERSLKLDVRLTETPAEMLRLNSTWHRQITVSPKNANGQSEDRPILYLRRLERQ